MLKIVKTSTWLSLDLLISSAFLELFFYSLLSYFVEQV